MLHKVLIIDDERTLLENLAAYLEDEGYEVETSVTAESGLSKLRRFEPDAVIVDLRLQGVNGETFVKTAYGIDSGLRFLIHTGSREYELSQDLCKLGLSAANIVYKPVPDLAVLCQSLQKLLPSCESAIKH